MTDVQVKAFLNGISPRSEALVAATRAHDRGRISDDELRRQYERDYAELIQLQRAARLDYLSDGLLNWQDLFRPFCDLVKGWEPGPLVRTFDNNTFYRQPHVRGALKLDEAKLGGWLQRYFKTDLDAQGPWKATLPSPYFTAHAALDEHYREPRSLMLAYVEELLIPIVQRLAERGVTFVQLQEPWLVFYPPEPSSSELEALREALRRLRGALPSGVKLGLYTYFGDAAPYLPQLLELPMDAVGVDFVETDVEALPPFAGKELIAGCVDARSSWVETPEQITAFAERVAKALAPGTLYLTPNADLEFVPQAIARRKVEALGQAAASLLQGQERQEGGNE